MLQGGEGVQGLGIKEVSAGTKTCVGELIELNVKHTFRDAVNADRELLCLQASCQILCSPCLVCQAWGSPQDIYRKSQSE